MHCHEPDLHNQPFYIHDRLFKADLILANNDLGNLLDRTRTVDQFPYTRTGLVQHFKLPISRRKTTIASPSMIRVAT